MAAGAETRTAGRAGAASGGDGRREGRRDEAAPEDAWLRTHIVAMLWPRGKPWLRARTLAAALLMLAGKLVLVAAPLFYREIVDGLAAAPAAVVVPAVLIFAYGFAHVASQLIGALRRLLFMPVAQRAVRKAGIETFHHLHSLSLRFHLDRRTGGVAHVIHRGTKAIEALVDAILFGLLPALVELALVSVILWRLYSAGIAATVAATLILYGLFATLLTRRQIRLRRAMNKLDVAASITATDSLLNYETIKYFAAEPFEAERYEKAVRDYEQAALSSGRSEVLFSVGQAAIIAAGLITVMLLVGGAVARGEASVGDFVLVVSYILQLYAPMGALGSIYSGLRQWLTDVEAMSALLGEKPDVTDRPGAADLAAPRGHVLFDDVCFAYDPRRPILDNISFEIPPGHTVALVGESGGGKSTIARLLFRFYDVASGAIRIDGQDLRGVRQASLRKAIGVVPQDTVLFNESLHYNIAYGRPGAGRGEVEEAARLAHLDAVIARMPDGFETRVGERGLKLSGGEKQRVAIARLILKQPSLMIFDEATSALDSRTEKEIQANLREVSAGRSTLVIAHRLSTIVDADEILVLAAGRIAERGRHADLVAAGGLYAQMWERQRRREEREAAAV